MNIASFFNIRFVFVVSLLVALAALGAAFVAQFTFGMKPCILCLYARIPYAAIIVIALVGLLNDKLGKPMLVLLMIGFWASFAISFFHIGVEQHWWTLSGGCPVEALGDKTSEQALAELLSTPLAPCDKVAWTLFGFSIVMWNALLSLMMSDFVTLAFVLGLKKRHDA